MADGSYDTRDFLEAAKSEYDLLVIGGGIVGTGIARDASMRGLSVILFEKEDLSSGTSSKSSRLIHGGLRYLDSYDFGLVFKDLHERETLLRIAPHLVKPLPFLIPNYDARWIQKFRLRFGMVLYDLFSSGKSLPSHKMLSRDQLLELEPALSEDGLQGGAMFYDCQVEFAERLSIENALSAAEHRARIFTHSEVIAITRSGTTVTGAIVQDQFSQKTYSFRSKVVMNAAGPWADNVLGLAVNDEKDLRKTKGIHIVFPKITERALVLYAKSDGRLIFVIPWLGRSLVGTTDTNFERDPATAQAERDDVEYLLRNVAILIKTAKEGEVEFVYAGVRPLVRNDSKSKESSVSRNYKIRDHKSEGAPGLISALGVKLTSFRAASKDAVDLV
ncbi:MAG: glycerol-3-phosphate dehydrogenase/oxidase, partial [Thaumarchaeota archaeon]|nr:glycerol-3-phosphate dehydrogenase/oxidase [Nitrososphaerota archaeon]